MSDRIFYKGLQRNGGDGCLKDGACNVVAAMDIGTEAQAFQLHEFFRVFNFRRHSRQISGLFLHSVDDIREKDQLLARKTVFIPGLFNSGPVNDVQNVIEKMRTHLLLKRVGT